MVLREIYEGKNIEIWGRCLFGEIEKKRKQNQSVEGFQGVLDSMQIVNEIIIFYVLFNFYFSEIERKNKEKTV